LEGLHINNTHPLKRKEKKRKEGIISIREERRKQGTGHCQTGLLSPGNMGPTYAPSSQNLVSSSSPFEGL
jgi:hypothetical protein